MKRRVSRDSKKRRAIMKAKRGVFLLLKKRGASHGPYNCNSIKKKEYSHLLPRRLKLLLQYHIFTNIQINKHTYIHTYIYTYIHISKHSDRNNLTENIFNLES